LARGRHTGGGGCYQHYQAWERRDAISRFALGLPFLFGFIVKKELKKIQIFAAGMRGIGCVVVSRDGGNKGYDVLDDVAREVAGGKEVRASIEALYEPGYGLEP
jgi:1-acyl-sn-glycerol-3-phosphate acyltransferase